MPVYVDNAKLPFRGMLMSHLWADTDAELIAMAATIGINRKWIQGHPTLSFGKHRAASWVHFDICQTKRARAVKAGAIETDRYGPLEHRARLDLASDIPARVARGRRDLQRVTGARMIGAANG